MIIVKFAVNLYLNVKS